TFRITERIAHVRALDESRHEGRLGQGDVLQILAEIDLRGFAETVDAEAAALPQVNRIGVVLEDLLLRELLLEMERDQRLGDLSVPGSLGIEPQSPRQLHRERGGALPLLSLPQIHARRASDTDRIESNMREK